MKLGYSLLLSEYVEAPFIEYGDCKHFQIVCPSCKEPVFKVVREPVPSEQIHYLSHYERDEAYETECELRVSRISTEEVKRANSLSRSQKIEYFLRIFQDALLKHEYPPDSASQEVAKRNLRKLQKSKALAKLRDSLFGFSRDPRTAFPEAKLYEHFDDYITDVQEIGGEFPKTAFSIQVQKRIAADVWGHLLSAKARENFFFLFNHAYCMLLHRLQLAHEQRGLFPYEANLFGGMARILDANKEEGLRVLQMMREYAVGSPHSPEGSNLFIKLCYQLSHEMFGTLIRFPYFELLRKNQTLKGTT